MFDLNNPNDMISTIVFLIETILFSLLILARLNARRLKIDTHHKYVYTVVLVNSVIILTWMLPRELSLLDKIIQGKLDPVKVWYISCYFWVNCNLIRNIYLCCFLNQGIETRTNSIAFDKENETHYDNYFYILVISFFLWFFGLCKQNKSLFIIKPSPLMKYMEFCS